MLAFSQVELYVYLQQQVDINPYLTFADSVYDPEASKSDVTIRKRHGTWQVEINAPRIALRMDNRDDTSPDPKARARAVWLIQGIRGRNRILLQVTRTIVAQQIDFLEKRTDWPRRLTLKRIAQFTGYHPSTVHRVLRHKLADTPRGVMPLTFLLSPFYAPERIRAAIRHIVLDTPGGHMLSDQAIALRLQQQGLAISRRTVSKYRFQSFSE